MAKLIINGEREYAATGGVISIGRAADNQISLAEDANISRYHAEIEERAGEFWLIELGSSNGTTVNGSPVTNERRLKDGDLITLGGSSEIVFELEKEASAETAATASATSAPVAAAAETPPAPSAAAEVSADSEKVSKTPVMLAVMGVLCGLALVCVVAVILVSWSSQDAECAARAEISNPDSGETISEAVDVQASVTNGECVGRAIFILDGREFASADRAPYKVSLDPSRFGEGSDELHSLRLVLEDTKGNKIPQPGEVLLAFETLATPTPTPENGAATMQPTPKPAPTVSQLSATEMPEAARRLTKQFPKSSAYKYDPQFLQEVQKKTAEYASEGFFARAQSYRDVINVAYVQEQNLDAPLGYLLAMSRSKFNPQKQGAEEGLWRMSNEFVTANSLNGMCGTETIADASQNCAAKASALYLKSIALNVFEGDLIYSVAAFGMSPQEAAIWKAGLPADRSNFWSVIRSPKQREEVVKFFAAGIVAENPQKFGLKKDRPLSEVYRNLMGN